MYIDVRLRNSMPPFGGAELNLTKHLTGCVRSSERPSVVMDESYKYLTPNGVKTWEFRGSYSIGKN